MADWITNVVFLLSSMVPAFEARGASLFFICTKQIEFVVISIILNFIGVIIFLKIMDATMLPEKLNSYIQSKNSKIMKRIEPWFEKHGNFALFLLLALPGTGIGSYTAGFIGKFFRTNTTLFYVLLFSAIIISVLPSFFVIYGVHILGLGC
ncbi:MAG: hypothetical protein J4473_05040 [Candidatus Aenigmarchaeota archaeon]|nr:hypothetical protein [Candidatus Aenigmarchaeota archaeon]